MKQRLFILAAMAATLSAQAETKTWVAVLAEGETEASAAVAANWDPAGIPAATDDIVLDGDRSNVPMVWTVAASGDSAPATVASWTQRSTYTARVTMPTTRTGAFTLFTVTGNATLDGGSWWRAGNTKEDSGKNKTTAVVWLNLAFNRNLVIGSGFTFDGYNTGYYKQTGFSPASSDNKGAAHGGLGAGNTHGYGTAYGDYREPISLGSGAYDVGGDYNGGCAILLTVIGNLVMNGTITADGGDNTNGPGPSGGSVLIRASRLLGTGTITAEGGSPSAKKAGGGGGRISILLTGEDMDYSAFWEQFTGTIRARGGYPTLNGSYSRTSGGAGTIYIETPADEGRGHMILLNGDWAAGKGTTNFNADTPIRNGETWNVRSLDMQVNGHVRIAQGGTLHVPAFSVITGDDSAYASIRLYGGSLVSDVKYDKLVADGFHVAAYATTDFSAYRLVVPAGSTLTVADGTVLTVGELTLNGDRLAKGTHSAATLAETYSNVAGTGSITVAGLTPETVVLLR